MHVQIYETTTLCLPNLKALYKKRNNIILNYTIIMCGQCSGFGCINRADPVEEDEHEIFDQAIH